MSSLKQHFDRVTAEKKGHKPTKGGQDHHPDNHQPPPDPLELKFFNACEQLTTIQSKERRNQLKAEYLPDYFGYIEGTIASGTGVQNDMLIRLMIWALDTQDLKRATDIAEFALLHDMAMPAGFDRSLATFFAEQFATEIIKNTAKASLDDIERAIKITENHDMPDEVRAKLYRVLGENLKNQDPECAITAFETALRLDDKVGVKQDLNALKKQA